MFRKIKRFLHVRRARCPSLCVSGIPFARPAMSTHDWPTTQLRKCFEKMRSNDFHASARILPHAGSTAGSNCNRLRAQTLDDSKILFRVASLVGYIRANCVWYWYELIVVLSNPVRHSNPRCPDAQLVGRWQACCAQEDLAWFCTNLYFTVIVIVSEMEHLCRIGSIYIYIWNFLSEKKEEGKRA